MRNTILEIWLGYGREAKRAVKSLKILLRRNAHRAFSIGFGDAVQGFYNKPAPKSRTAIPLGRKDAAERHFSVFDAWIDDAEIGGDVASEACGRPTRQVPCMEIIFVAILVGTVLFNNKNCGARAKNAMKLNGIQIFDTSPIPVYCER